MDLSSRCINAIGSRDWRRGQEYADSGAVEIMRQQGASLAAEVQGSAINPYLVRLDWSEADQHTLLVYCSCPRFDDVGICKHVAATIIAASNQFGLKVPGKGKLFLEPLEVDAPLDEDDDYWPLQDGLTGGPAIGSAKRKTTRDTRSSRNRRAKPAVPNWRKLLDLLADVQASKLRRSSSNSPRPWSKPRQIWYVLDIAQSLRRGWPWVSLFQRPLKKDGTPGKLKAAVLTFEEANNLASDEDRRLFGLLVGNEREAGYGYYGLQYDKHSAFCISPAMFDVLLPRLCASGRFGWLPADRSNDDDEVRLLSWDDGPPWTLALDVAKSTDQKHWRVAGKLTRGTAAEELSHPLILLAAGLVVFRDRIARFDPGTDFSWVAMLRGGELSVPMKQEQEFVEHLAKLPSLPAVELPAELQWDEVRQVPIPQLKITPSKQSWEEELICRLSFQYGDQSAAFGGGEHAWYDRKTRRLLRRDDTAESAARDQLLAAGARRPQHYAYNEQDQYFVAPNKLSQLVLQLAAAGWQVEAEGRKIRRPGNVTISVTSDVDWFDLEGACDFEGVTASLPKLLSALRAGEQYVVLDDGSRGLLPNEWLARYAPLAELGQVQDDRLRFIPTQAALLDALLASQESDCVSVDKAFEKMRDRLRSFGGIRQRKEPRSFVGELRSYQREGLGWLQFLDDFGFGGCLADDMGLGKTVQVLALLDGRRRQQIRGSEPRDKHKPQATARPSLVVVPRSLVFNWIEEAGRFTPKLRVLNYTGLDRGAALDQLNKVDLVVTTYGTLRRDVAKLREIEFDYAILDEAQAVKNAASQANKACRLLRARRRLAMTGTPLENHVGEIWSLFEFLNPGMLGRSPKLHELFSAGRRSRPQNGDARADDQRSESLALLSQALRPFLLRRTKRQVLTELPPKTEQTLYCELDAGERKLYDELREHYRQTLLARVKKMGVNKSKIHVLEALLRLRQASCHVGLLDKKKIDAPSSKLETLLEQLDEVLAEGHKALVFSQFTSYLAILRRHLDKRKLVYEYLDGRTVKRQAKVERFQSDSDCRLFLISLKAGGLGLNLTAADYVFILDPWWNPAIEAQAVDRAHRIGQDRHVFAYRLIARDTVEEKILQLQERKRGLAEAIISADNSLLRNLTADDLQILLS